MNTSDTSERAIEQKPVPNTTIQEREGSIIYSHDDNDDTASSRDEVTANNSNQASHLQEQHRHDTASLYSTSTIRPDNDQDGSSTTSQIGALQQSLSSFSLSTTTTARAGSISDFMPSDHHLSDAERQRRATVAYLTQLGVSRRLQPKPDKTKGRRAFERIAQGIHVFIPVDVDGQKVSMRESSFRSALRRNSRA